MELIDSKSTSVKEHLATMSPYYYHFLQGYNYRESCYHCKYARKERCSDITLCDFWGIDSVAPEMNNFYGVSGVLLNSEKGVTLWESVQSDLISKQVDIMDIVKHNGQLKEPSTRPHIRDQYYIDESNNDFNYLTHKYNAGRLLIFDTLKDAIPNRYRQRIKKFLNRIVIQK